MPRLLSKVSGTTLPKTPVESFYQKVEFHSFKDDGRFIKSEEVNRDHPNGFYKTKSGKNIFLFDYQFYEETRYMPAWCFYNFATNFKKNKMNEAQYEFWRTKMGKEGKRWMLFDYD